MKTLPKKITCGVPQGSCISPTLFILFFSDVVNKITANLKTALFADDLCIWTTDKNLKIIEIRLQKAIDEIIKFCNTNELVINKLKTVHTTFTSAGLRGNYRTKYQLNVKIGDEKIPLDPHPCFLGIKLDPKLDFKEHLSMLKNKIAIKMKLIKRVKSLKITNAVRLCLTIYKSCIRSLIDYCFVISHVGNGTLIKELQKVQNASLRCIKFFPFKTSIVKMHSDLKIGRIEPRLHNLLVKYVDRQDNSSLIRIEWNYYKESLNITDANSQKTKLPFDFLDSQ